MQTSNGIRDLEDVNAGYTAYRLMGYGITPREVRYVRVVQSGDDSVHTVEARYLVPYIHSLMEIDSIRIPQERLQHSLMFVGDPIAKLRKTHIGSYIRWGERQAFHLRPTCAARTPWYDLTASRRPPIIYPKIQQYRHIVVWNNDRYLCASSLLELFPKEDVHGKALCAVLNSTVSALAKHVFGRQHGREGSLQLDVYAANMMLTPDLRQGTSTLLERLAEMVDSLGRRKSRNLPDEFVLDDRRKLDDLVLQLIGMADAANRDAFLKRLYAQMTEMYRAIREAEIEMQRFRLRMARRDQITPRSLAESIWESIDKDSLRHFPSDFVPQGTKAERIELVPAKRVKLETNLFKKIVVSADRREYAFDNADRAAFVARLLEEGIVGKIDVPLDAGVCSDAVSDYEEYRQQIENRFQESSAEYSSKQDFQDKIVAELWKLHRAVRLGEGNTGKQGASA